MRIYPAGPVFPAAQRFEYTLNIAFKLRINHAGLYWPAFPRFLIM
jgi:hypothetical protein